MTDKFDALFDIPIDVTFSGEKGDPGRDGKDGKDGVDGQDGVNGKDGLPGERGAPGKDGIDGKSVKGERGRDGKDGKDGLRGEDGLSAYEIWLQDGNEGDEEEFLRSLKGKDGKTPQYHGNAYTELKEQEDVSIANPSEGDLLVYDGSKWSNSEYNINDLIFARPEVEFTSQTSVTVMHNKGFKPGVDVLDEDRFERIPFNIQHSVDSNSFTVSFTTPKTGVVVYDSVGAPNSGVPVAQDGFVVQELTSSGNISNDADVVFCTGTLTANFPDPTLISRKVDIRNISGTTTLTTDAGTIERTELTVGQSSGLVTRATGWFEV